MSGLRHADVGVFYCIAHEGVANEDDDVCDMKRMDEAFVLTSTRPEPCDFRQCRIQRSPKAAVDRSPRVDIRIDPSAVVDGPVA